MGIFSILTCFGNKKTMSDDATMVGSLNKGGVESGSVPFTQAEKVVENCIFCDITPDKFDIILENENFVVFSDIAPAARIHLLAIPRAHVFNVKSLHGEQGAKMVEELKSIGSKALEIVDARIAKRKSEKVRGSMFRYGMHISPFNSVDHLHLHCLGLPFNSAYSNLKYRIAPGDPNANPPTNKGWGWFVTSDQAIAILRKGQEVTVSPC